jgi:hypothetical protein
MIHWIYMAKKVVRKRRSAKRVAKNGLLVNELFTFPKLVVYAIILLSMLILYQVTRPVDVKGTSTVVSNK